MQARDLRPCDAAASACDVGTSMSRSSRHASCSIAHLVSTCAAVAVNKDVTLAITSDKGLCGGLNTSITKVTRTLLKMNASGELQQAAACAAVMHAWHGRNVVGEQAGLTCFAVLVMLAEEGTRAQTVVAVGDKGRSQLSRAESNLFALSIADTYKVRVTFAQVRQ